MVQDSTKSSEIKRLLMTLVKVICWAIATRKLNVKNLVIDMIALCLRMELVLSIGDDCLATKKHSQKHTPLEL